ncbi:GNAT family N-acetyltransferase [Nocardiopsis tropica]|uniref:GNAT family N-acetyltransferase n=1 Tax=Nocardiopsis tropica TaxID=109330 RepID=A0ABU7KTP5_9ACTN|nr:GNAT family N-acetyltransferase [Nocardiopsis umidischolae]MEE2052675.1 GNAT family N-acetyltransferase [Nocardiopsis umidischolae]
MSPTAAAARTLRTANMNDVPAVARLLGRAFHEDPFFRWFFPTEDRRMARTARACALMAGFGYVPSGYTTVAECREDSVRGPVMRGAALWTPPGAAPEGFAVTLRSLPHWSRLVGLSRIPEIARYTGELRAAVPEEPHWYLALLGADPGARGTGVGSQLLRAGLARADADGVPVHLDTTNPANLGYYERYGFQVVRVVSDPRAPSAYCMVRPPAA